MIYRIVLGILMCGIIQQFSYSQTNNIIAVRDLILEKLNIPNDIYYDNIESAFSAEDISIKVKRYNNKYDDHLNDFLYVLYFNSYQITLYKSATSEKYFITEIEIDANIFYCLRSSYPNQYRDH
jgi:adenylate cyclase class IV